MLNKIELKIGDIFAGAGGLSLGFILANHPLITFRPLFAIDNDKNSLQSYKYSTKWLYESSTGILSHLPQTFVRDVQQLNVKAVLRLFKITEGELDLLIGGPPCQGYSSANRQSSAMSKSDRNRLSKIFFDKLEEFRPKMFLLENVQGVKWTKPTSEMELTVSQLPLLPDTSQDLSNVQQYMLERASKLGYKLWKNVLNAVDFGVPQNRYRFFLFGVRSDILPSNSEITLDSILEELRIRTPITVNDAIGDLPALENGESWTGEYHPNTECFYAKSMRSFMENGDLFEHFATKHANYVIERYKKIPEGKNWESIRDLMSNYSKIDNTHSNIYRRLKRDAPAITISHYRKSMIIHPTQDRGISFREACRLQSFPDWYRFFGSLDHRQQQLANAVPPLLASKLAYTIATYWSDLNRYAPFR